MKARIGGREVELNIEDRLAPVRRSQVPKKDRPHGAVVRGGPVPCNSPGGGLQDAKKRTAVPPSSPHYDSKLEAAWAQRLKLDLQAGLIAGWMHHPFSFRLAEGVRYTVDFITWGEEGTVCYECKGWHKNMRDSLTRLQWAAQRFPFHKWRKVVREKGQWQAIDIVV
jgi:hypothetical protein